MNEQKNENIQIELARLIAAQAWCDEETKHLEMEPNLCEAFAMRLAGWLETAAQFDRNANFYRYLLDECAISIGQEAYTADDGSIKDKPIRLKIPALVKQLVDKNAGWIRIDLEKPSYDDNLRILVYTEGVDFNGEQVFDIKADVLIDKASEVAEAATHWRHLELPITQGD
jgi:hypothetical protein